MLFGDNAYARANGQIRPLTVAEWPKVCGLSL